MGSRYERNILVKDFGAAGQAALQNARIGVLGAGGLGSPILYYLAAAGAGYLKVVDFDAVEESNLQRQILHDTARIGRRKAESAARTLRTLNPEITVDAICERVGKHNAARILVMWTWLSKPQTTWKQSSCWPITVKPPANP